MLGNGVNQSVERLCAMLPKLLSAGMVASRWTASCRLQAREAKQQGAAAKHERKAEAREARHEGHHGIRASLDKGADFARGRVASLARRGSGTVAPSGLAGAGWEPCQAISLAYRLTVVPSQTSVAAGAMFLKQGGESGTSLAPRIVMPHAVLVIIRDSNCRVAARCAPTQHTEGLQRVSVSAPAWPGVPVV